MRFEMSRHLDDVSNSGKKVSPDAGIPEFDSYEYVVYLLHVDAEIEHSLMVQYLYAAYSLGGSGVDKKYRATVRKWQNTILGIAKEEMGHLITVQNVLRLIGAPLNFGREDYPSESHSDLGTFNLEPLSLQSLKKYVWVESPENWPQDDKLKREFKQFKNKSGKGFKVSELFKTLIDQIGKLPEELFQANSRPFQASLDEWGRGYERGERGNPSKEEIPFPLSPDLIVRQMSSRSDAVEALTLISHQGEDPDTDASAPTDQRPVSHFARFLNIYEDFKEKQKDGSIFQPCRKVLKNPYISSVKFAKSVTSAPEKSSSFQNSPLKAAARSTRITNPEAILWGHLFNVRYRLALNYLTHSFESAKPSEDNTGPTPRGLIIAATFGEMYNMRALADILMQTPYSETSKLCAGPPFQMPYTLSRPMGDQNRWLQHRHLLKAAALLITELERKGFSKANNKAAYLNSLMDSDQNLLKSIEIILK